MNSTLPFFTIFATTLMSSTLVALSSSHWFLMWMALELNLLSFIPLMSSSSKHQETEASIKYFLVQATGSALLLFSALWMYYTPLPQYITPFTLTLILSLLLKLGAAPMHFWFPNVMAGLTWISCLILSTWQKIIPLFILISFTSHSSFIIQLVSAISAMIGGLGGMNQSFLRPLLAYSSIGHVGWMLAASLLSLSYSLIYFLIYCLILVPLILLLNSSQISNLRQTNSVSYSSPMVQSTLLMILLSLGGLPPLLGFLSKWLVIEQMMKIMTSTPFLIILLLGSLMNLFYYLNVSFSLSLMPPSLTSLSSKSSNIMMLSIPSCVLMLLMSPMIFLIS